MPEQNFWGRLIKTLREEQGYTQRTLSIAAKVSRSTLRSMEAGCTSGDVDILERLLRTLGYELEAMATNSIRPLPGTSLDGNPGRRARVARQRVLAMPIELLSHRF